MQVTGWGRFTRAPAAAHSGCTSPGCAQSEKQESSPQPELGCSSASCQYLTSLSSWIISPVLNHTPFIPTQRVCFQRSLLGKYWYLIKAICLTWKVPRFLPECIIIHRQYGYQTSGPKRNWWGKKVVMISALDSNTPRKQGLTWICSISLGLFATEGSMYKSSIHNNRKNSSPPILFSRLVPNGLLFRLFLWRLGRGRQLPAPCTGPATPGGAPGPTNRPLLLDSLKIWLHTATDRLSWLCFLLYLCTFICRLSESPRHRQFADTGLHGTKFCSANLKASSRKNNDAKPIWCFKLW